MLTFKGRKRGFFEAVSDPGEEIKSHRPTVSFRSFYPGARGLNKRDEIKINRPCGNVKKQRNSNSERTARETRAREWKWGHCQDFGEGVNGPGGKSNVWRRVPRSY